MCSITTFSLPKSVVSLFHRYVLVYFLPHSGKDTLCLSLCVCSYLVGRVPLFYNPINCSPPGSSVHGISQERILDWVAISFSRGSAGPRDQTRISCISCFGGQILYHCATWEACVLLVQRIFPTQRLNPCLLSLQYWQTDSLSLY